MTVEPKYRYAGVKYSGPRDPRHMLDVPKNMTVRQAMKAWHMPLYVRLWVNALIIYSKVVGRLTRPFRRNQV